MLGAAPSTTTTLPSTAAGSVHRRPWLAYLGPACLVSVGYMDPGNWATDLEGGARFGFQLLWVLVLSNLMALLLQDLSSRLALTTGLDLASACRVAYSPGVSVGLWILAELAIVACDLAELLGSAIALNLLFGLPLVLGALLTSLDVLLILALERWGAGRIQALVACLLLTIAICVGIELVWARPDLGKVSQGLVPRIDGQSLYVAIGILGATVMPHNLYLQSGLLSRAPARTEAERRNAFSRNRWSTAVALNVALFVNAAILILAAAVFGGRGAPVTSLSDASRLLSPLLGQSAASVLFALGLLCAGQSSTLTGTLAGQIVMEGFVELRMPPWARRALTRGLAIVPAVLVLLLFGESSTMALLLGSQVVLCLQLPFAIVPMIRLVRAQRLMGRGRVGPVVSGVAAICAGIVGLANAALVARTVQELAPGYPVTSLVLALIAVTGLLFLVFITLTPLKWRAPIVGRASAETR